MTLYLKSVRVDRKPGATWTYARQSEAQEGEWMIQLTACFTLWYIIVLIYVFVSVQRVGAENCHMMFFAVDCFLVCGCSVLKLLFFVCCKVAIQTIFKLSTLLTRSARSETVKRLYVLQVNLGVPISNDGGANSHHSCTERIGAYVVGYVEILRFMRNLTAYTFLIF